MPCGDCKHWSRISSPIGPGGCCLLLSEEFRLDPRKPNDQVLYASHKTRERQKKRRGRFESMTTWTDGHLLKTLQTMIYTAPNFFCALYDRDKRKKRLPVVGFGEEAPKPSEGRTLWDVLNDD